MYSGVNANNTPPYHGMHQMNGNLVNGGSSNHLGTTASGHSQHAVPVTTTTNVNGFVEFSPNGGIMSTTSATNMAASYQNQFATQAHYYGASQTPFHQTHVSAMPGAVTHNTHYGSPTNLFTKFSIGLTQQGPNGQPGGGPTLQTNRTGLNTGSLSTSGTFRNNITTVVNSNAKHPVNMYQATQNNHQTASTSPVNGFLSSVTVAINHHNNSSVSKSAIATGSGSGGVSLAARGLQSAFNLAATPFTPSSGNGGTLGGVLSPSTTSSSTVGVLQNSTSSTSGYYWTNSNNKSIVKA